MAYIVDYSGDHAFVDGVVSATYTDPSGNVDNQVKVRLGSLGMTELQAGAVFGVSMGDVPFTVWNETIINGELLPGGRLLVAGTGFQVLSIGAVIPDGSQTRIITRKERS